MIIVYDNSKRDVHQCEERNLTRPMVVTHPLSAEAGRPLAPPAGQQPLRPSISQLSKPSPDSSSAMLDVVQFIGIVSTAFVMGIVLMGALCCIYTRTGTGSSLAPAYAAELSQ
ncbi:hypothetical protein N1851_028155 [Merluccius polli]|uniref:Uncharacterized protein n=1 Tax=Merluccius polli TaxID=89951 RepID=A0AA47M954_MERPO|nr:hypothetical protein N1851_028155 [Merluccius polli]